ncbi:cyclin-dependent kinase inhibitor 1 isoform X2 [Melanotaenia boesemani]|uniref:cyclin-dependent kinase inhibitor 1 isoform X2 n=1 Tax=Melanotaenia boesemani TaxID=1250792 RepID=UPI001C04FCE8|nr:cyclin-dependent kinase inhibitor 1 isoform X2 [Melanotaenia boesemani]
MCRVMASHKRLLSALRSNGPARRTLFGPVDREQLQLEYQTALRKDLEEASQRWGFDFISDKPLATSDFQWEDIRGTRVPLLYRSCMHGVGQGEKKRAAVTTVSPKRERVEPLQCEKENIPHTQERCPLKLESWEKTPERAESTGIKRKQTNITDFYQAKRRVVWMPRKSGE